MCSLIVTIWFAMNLSLSNASQPLPEPIDPPEVSEFVKERIERNRKEYNEELIKCQKCGGKLKLVLYGMPNYTPELQEALDNDEVVLGGCVISGGKPHFICDCDK